MKILFWLSLSIIFYAYFGYMLILALIYLYQRIFKRNQFRNNYKANQKNLLDEDLPTVSFIITAYNEERRINEKLNSSLCQIYPKEKLEIIVASDCSTDKTDEIVISYADKGVKLIRAPERKGKENAQMYAVRDAVGEILVFSDVATILKPDAIKLIVKNFQDNSIGCVSSEDHFIDRDGKISGEGLYVRYEMFIRKLESLVNSLVGLSGSFFAARSDVCKNWEPDLQSDFNTLLNSIKLGLRGISDSKSIGYYYNIADVNKEFQRKVRTVLRGISVLMRNLSLFNIKKYGLFSWQLFSHKLCRWSVPFLLIIAFISNIFIAFDSVFFLIIFILQIFFYASAYSYHRKMVKGDKIIKEGQYRNMNTAGFNRKLILIIYNLSIPIFKFFCFFLTVNFAILYAWFKFFKGERSTFWEPSKR